MHAESQLSSIRWSSFRQAGHVYTRRFATRAEARETIFVFIEVFYKRRRRHSTIGYVSPVEFEMKFNQEKSTEKLAT